MGSRDHSETSNKECGEGAPASSSGNRGGISTQCSWVPCSDGCQEGEHLEAIALTRCLLKGELPGLLLSLLTTVTFNCPQRQLPKAGQPWQKEVLGCHAPNDRRNSPNSWKRPNPSQYRKKPATLPSIYACPPPCTGRPVPSVAPGQLSPIPARAELTCDVEDVVGDASWCHSALGCFPLQNGHHGLQLVQGPCQA